MIIIITMKVHVDLHRYYGQEYRTVTVKLYLNGAIYTQGETIMSYLVTRGRLPPSIDF